MSLVTTASSISPPSARHSAATSAVLPLPTGPPMRIARPAAGDCSWWSCTVNVGSNETGCSWSADKETHLLLVDPRMGVGEQVQGGRAAHRQAFERLVSNGVEVHPGHDRVDPERIQAEQPYRGTGRTAHRQVGGALRRLTRRAVGDTDQR